MSEDSEYSSSFLYDKRGIGFGAVTAVGALGASVIYCRDELWNLATETGKDLTDTVEEILDR